MKYQLKNHREMKKGIIAIFSLVLMASCVSKKKYTALENKLSSKQEQLSKTKLELAACLENKKDAQQEISYLKNTNYKLLNSVGKLTTLNKKEAENLERSLESIQEKDMTIRRLEDALNRRDSVTFALVSELKGATVGLSDEDIQINVEKGVVYVSISDRLLFESGSFDITKDARTVLGKVAKVLKNQPDLDFMVVGHTDNKDVLSSAPYRNNWDLSVLRAASVVKALEDEYNLSPKRMTAAGRGKYAPKAPNETEEGRAKNRRTTIKILPKLDEFYSLIEKGLGEAKK